MRLDHDVLKLGGLALLWCVCLSTWFTSPGTVMGDPIMPKLKPDKAKFCGIAKDNSEANLKVCEEAVGRAYDRINMGGCPYEIRSRGLCESEWCHGPGFSADDCERECDGVRKALASCVEAEVKLQFRLRGM